ncbi:MAG: MBL fold metallo-hydrolase [Chloroflexi bacterium]|nr:MBL fold metallo-hydrolase [Chloroflexota bacterium]
MIHRVLAPNPGMMTGAGTNTYVVDGGTGTVAVVDPGPDDDRHLDAIAAAAAPLGRITMILVTHGHADHLPAAFPLARRTGGVVLGHRLLPGVQRTLREGDVVELGRYHLEALETPGHTDDSLCYWDAGTQALFTGDLIAGAGTVIVDDAPGGLGKYMRSLDRLRGMGATHLYPGHGPSQSDGLAKVEEYWRHRMGREGQILAALAAGSADVEVLVQQLYTETPRELLGMAARNVRAHLDKLRDENRVEREGSRWRLT